MKRSLGDVRNLGAFIFRAQDLAAHGGTDADFAKLIAEAVEAKVMDAEHASALVRSVRHDLRPSAHVVAPRRH